MTGQMRITFKIHITFNNMTKPWHSRKKQTGKMIQDYRHILEELPLVNHDLRESILYYWLENKLIVFLYLYFQVRNEQSFQITFNSMKFQKNRQAKRFRITGISWKSYL